MQIIRTTHQPSLGGWTPFHRVSPLHDLIDSALNLASSGSQARDHDGWNPALAVFEDEDAFVVEFEAAGMKKDDFNISLHEGSLTVSGERRSEKTEREGESFRSERFFGSFSRTVEIPTAVKADAVGATYADGILRVSLPKAEDAKPRQIEVQVK